jgi:uncharacterized protein (TIGR03084 family)
MMAAERAVWGAVNGMDEISEDLAAEQGVLESMVTGLDGEGWSIPTAAAGWDVRETIVHVAFYDDAARLAIVDPAAFAELLDRAMRGGFDVPAAHAHLSGPEVFVWWREARAGLLRALRPLDPKDRIPWFGPPMSARSFATARLMETWSHGWDVAEALGRPDPPTDRLRHVAHLGVVTRGWSYAVRGRPVPEEPVRVELQAPSGAAWTWGPDEVADVVRGPALDFCLAVTQRRPVDATDLEVIGPLAREWMAIAQAFAGVATTTDPERSPS